MSKYVIETCQVIKRKYYVEVDDPVWAHDSIVMGELDNFSSAYMAEDIWSTQKVDEWPVAERGEEMVNASTQKFNYDEGNWDESVRWDLDPTFSKEKELTSEES